MQLHRVPRSSKALPLARPDAASLRYLPACRPRIAAIPDVRAIDRAAVFLWRKQGTLASVIVVPRAVFDLRRNPDSLLDFLKFLLHGQFITLGDFRVLFLGRTREPLGVQTWRGDYLAQLTFAFLAGIRTRVIDTVFRPVDHLARIAGVLVDWHFVYSSMSTSMFVDDASLHVSRRRLCLLRIFETNQTAMKAFGHCRAGTVYPYSLSGKMWRHSLNDRPRAIVWLLPCGRSSNLFSHISPEKRILREICRLARHE